jgi:TRAP transporter TAXI family solute receptor
MINRMLFIWTVMAVLLGLCARLPVQADSIGMVTGSETGTYFRFGQDIARVAQQVGLEIMVKDSEGSIDNIRRLVSAENAALAIVQSDVLGFLSWSPDPQVQRLTEQLRLIFPFYNEEVHVLARTEIQRLEDLARKRVVVGTQGSGNWLTANHLLRILDIEPAELITTLPPPEAVHAVLTGKADAMFYVAGKPVKLFTTISQLQSDPRYANLVQEVHFVPLEQKRVLQEYIPSTISAEDYSWVQKTIPTVAVKAVLISFDFSRKSATYYRQRCQQLARLGAVIRDNLADLQRTGHPKWQEVDLDQRVSVWKRDVCSHTMRPGRRQDEGLQKDLTDILKGKRQR